MTAHRLASMEATTPKTASCPAPVGSTAGTFQCMARKSVGANDPQDCDYPACGCDACLAAEIDRILAMTPEECLAAGIAEYGSEEAWRSAMAAMKAKMLATVDAHIAAHAPTPDPAVMRDYIERLTRFFIDRPEWITLAEEARGYIGALTQATAAAKGDGGEGVLTPKHAPNPNPTGS